MSKRLTTTILFLSSAPSKKGAPKSSLLAFSLLYPSMYMVPFVNFRCSLSPTNPRTNNQLALQMHCMLTPSRTQLSAYFTALVGSLFINYSKVVTLLCTFHVFKVYLCVKTQDYNNLYRFDDSISVP